MKRYLCFIILSGIVLHNLTCAPSPKERGEALRERIYVQTDKQLYLAGEPVLMKFLTTSTKQIPLAFSKVAYAELVSDSIARVQIKAELIDGKGTGRMLLPIDLPTGYYRLIAYTQFMRNEGVDIFFEKMIAVVNTFQSGYYPAETEPAEPVPADFSETGGKGLSVQAGKATYPARARGELILNGLPENLFTMSVSIAGKNFIPDIESSVSLFRKNQTKQTTEFSGDFLPEFEGHIITGKTIENQARKTEANEQKNTGEGLSEPEKENDDIISFMNVAVLSFPSVEGIRFFAGQKSKTDEVRFVTSGISGTKEIATVMFNTGEESRIDILSPFVNRYAPKPMPALRLDSSCYRQLLERSVALQVFRYFADESSENQIIPEPHFKMKPTMSYLLDEYTRFTTMREVFIEFITGARFRRRDGKQEIHVFTKRGIQYDYGTMPLVLLDGVPVSNHDAVYNYDPLAVEKINVYYGPCVLGGYRFDGIVELITYRRLHQDLILNRSSQIISYEGPQLPYRKNYPDYSNDKNRQSLKPDSRHTLVWNPDIQTDGKTSIRLPFDTSDLTGEFQAIVEGITKDGEIVFATTFFKVEH